MASADAKALLRWLADHTTSMVELLERLARAETPSSDSRAQDQAFAIIERELRGIDYTVERVPGKTVGDHLHATPAARNEAAPAQLLLGHMDTVWPHGTLGEMPVRIRDGKLSGPGVYDMKAGIVQMLFALRALRHHDLTPDFAPVLFINTDEEIGSAESAPHIEDLARKCARAFVAEPSFGPSGALKTSRKGVAGFTLTMRGRASHAGIEPEQGISAILEASHQVQKLFALNDAERGITVNVGTIDGGLRPNVVAPEVKAMIDVRVRTEADALAVERAIKQLEPVQDGVELDISGGFGRPPMEPTARNRELWQSAQAAARELGIELTEASVGGASDGNITSRFVATLDGLGAVGDGAHAASEHVTIAHMPERAALLAALLMSPPGKEVA